MRQGRLQAADALTKRVGTAISLFNSKQLHGITSASGDGCKEMWKRVNSLCDKASPVPIQDEGLRADSINEYYAAVSNDESYIMPSSKSSCLPPVCTLTAPISGMMVYKAIIKLKTKATSFDCIQPWFIKLIGPFIVEPWELLYNASIAQSTVPSQWKVAQITPIPKIPCSMLPIHF